MRRIPRISSRGDFLLSQRRGASPASICIFCQHQQRSNLSTTTARPAKDPNNLTFLERTRNRIWGTDKPPGYDDPYTGTNYPRDGRDRGQKDDGTVVDLGGADPDSEEGIAALKRAQRESRMAHKRAMMDAIEDAPHHEDYVPATTWAGLETVTGDEEVDELGREFEGYLLPHRLRSELELSSALYRALVEVYAKVSLKQSLRQFERPLGLISDALAVKIQPALNGPGALLEFPNEEIRDAVVASIMDKRKAKVATEVEIPGLEEADVSAVTSNPDTNPDQIQDAETAAIAEEEELIDLGELDAKTAEEQELVSEMDRMSDLAVLSEYSSNWDSQWKSVSLSHPYIKLAVVRRASQLVGFRIPDTLIARSETAEILLKGLVDMQVKPRTLHEAITGENVEEMLDGRDAEMVEEVARKKAPLVGLPNVRVIGRRETVVDRERRVGRLKVIEEELKKRDLPLWGERKDGRGRENIRA